MSRIAIELLCEASESTPVRYFNLYIVVRVREDYHYRYLLYL